MDGMKFPYKELYADYKYLADRDASDDFCGVTCNVSLLMGIISKKITINDALIQLISAYFTKGYESGMHGYAEKNNWLKTDSKCKQIKEKYGIE